MQPKDWLNQFLADRQLSKPHGRPLYCYRMSEEEFNSLKETLKTSALCGISNVVGISGWNAVIVIYSAEWWRRCYDGGVWSWESIFASFDANASELNSGQRNLVIELGLGYWQRPVRIINGRSRYLGTIATEGGLPMRQLGRANWLSRLFKHVLPKYLRLYNVDIIDAIGIIRDYAPYHLPDNYQNDGVYAVLGDMICAVAKLKKDHSLADKPIDYLNLHVPGWQTQFPLPIDDNVGLFLLTDLINTAVKVETLTAPFRGRRLLSNDGVVQLVFEFSATIELEKITNKDNFPFRVDIEIVSDEGRIYFVGVALKTTVENKDMLRMPRCGLPPIQDDTVTQGYTLRFRHLSEIVLEQPLIEAIDENVPWTFVRDNDEWLLVGTASVRTRAKQVRILYEKDLTCSLDGVTEQETPYDRRLIEVSGVIELRDTDNYFRIQTDQDEATQQYYLSDKNRLNFSSIPKTVYVGLPELYCFNTETEHCEKINTPLLARPVNSKAPWQQLTTEQQGVYELRLQDEQGNIQFRKKCVLLPENFEVCFHATTRRISIENCGQAIISCPIGIVEDHSITFNTTERTPVFLDVTLDWQGKDKLTLHLPFPINTGFLIDSTGNKLKQIPVNELYGVRLRLLSENHHHNRHLILKFQLNDDPELYFRDSITKKGAVIELAMMDYQQWMKELLAISHHVDSFVRLTVDERGLELLRADIVRSSLLPSESVIRTNHCVNSIDEIKTLADALSICDDELRQIFIRHRLKQLCRDFAHNDWQNLRKQQNDTLLIENEIWTAATLENRVLVALVLQLDTAFMQRFVTELPVFWELILIQDWLVVFSRYKTYLAQIMDESDVKDFLTRAIHKISTISQSLETVVQLLKYYLFGDVDSSTQDNNALQSLKSKLKKEQQEMINRHPDVNEWLDLLRNEFNLYQQYITLKPLFNTLCYDKDGYEINKMRISASLTPLVLAHSCLTSIPPAWQGDNTTIFKLRQLKAFDEHWFNTAFCFTLSYLSQQSNYQQRLQQETEKMINADEDDLIPEIDDLIKLVEKEMSSAVQEAQSIKTQVPISFKNNGELRKLRSDYETLNNDHEQLTENFKTLEIKHNNLVTNIKTAFDKRDDAIRKLLTQVKILHQALQEIRQQLDQSKQSDD
ncbi:MAG: STY4851/ECs_5259 family protein [Methylovulum sp.]|nr:STY4851/ECs_5259 family protein [Methylovulum sp.]